MDLKNNEKFLIGAIVFTLTLLFFQFVPLPFTDLNEFYHAPTISTSIPRIETPKTQTRPYQVVSVEKSHLIDFLKDLSVKYEIDYEVISNVVICESNWNINAYNEIGKSYGVAQFIFPTWQYFNKLRGTDMDYLNPYHQLDMMAWAFKNNLQESWDCFRIVNSSVDK